MSSVDIFGPMPAGSDYAGIGPWQAGSAEAARDAVSGVTKPWAGYTIATSVFAGLSQAYAAFSSDRFDRIQQRSQESALRFRATMLDFDRRAAERQAQGILEQGKAQIGALTLEGGQRRAAMRTVAAAYGIDVGRGGDKLAQLSDRLIQDVEGYHINLNAVRAAAAARRGGTAIENQQALLRTQAAALRRSYRTIYPEAQLALGSLTAAAGGLGEAKGLSYRRS